MLFPATHRCLILALLLAFPLSLRGAEQKPPASEERLAELIEQLGDSQYWVRRRARDELREMGFAAFDALTAAEANPDLEISSSARDLIQLLRINWSLDSDPEEVKQLLSGYETLSVPIRLSRMERLATLLDGAGIEALCRLARFEKSPLLSKHAAIYIFSRSELGGEPAERQGDVILQTVGRSERPACQWLRTYASRREAPEAAALDWSKLAGDEWQVLATTPLRTDEKFVKTLLRMEVEQFATLGQIEKSTAAVEKLLDLETGAGDSLSELLSWLTRQEIFSGVDALVERFPDSFQNDPLTIYALAYARQRQGREEQAQQLADRAFQIRSDESAEHFRVAGQLRIQGLHDWARREYEHLINQKPYGEYSYYSQRYLSSMLYDQGEFADAAKILSQAVPQFSEFMKREQGSGRSLNPLLEELKGLAHYYQARAHEAAKEIDAQREELAKALQHDPTNSDTLIALYRSAGDDPKLLEEAKTKIKAAADKLRTRIEKEPREASAYNELAWLLSNTGGDLQEAARRSHKSLEIQPGTGAYLDTLARCYYELGELEKAVQYQRLAVAKEPSSGQISKQLEAFEQELKDKRQQKDASN